jgi:pimeloyl-ACP methyl ester carboxylesterase
VTVVFVHGVPEVSAIWDRLRAELGRDDTVALSPPGFGAPVPEGFGATQAEYASWLVGELERLDHPVDLIGHDWGGGHVIGASTARPDLVRRVATDIGGCLHPDYTWHDMAQTWRTPGDGEVFVEAMAGIPRDDRIATFESMGMARSEAAACADASGPEMGRCILALYRSAPEPAMAATGGAFAEVAGRPEAHVIIPTEDPFTGGEHLARGMAEAWGARVHVLEGLGHWWMLQDPPRAAAVLRDILG